MTYCNYCEDKEFKRFIDAYFSKLSEEEKYLIIQLLSDYI